ncbi:hypothetical protein P4O66_012627 [Electrophorus voltai]|uniref:Uncharacterized protein n=1 Tax=Electrophorus voltai TaxID=2609070 RepID=A0AAD8Z4Y9_9TELE|nr:hypothetical protein P4O66_012627 [Electrophorus voltai]
MCPTIRRASLQGLWEGVYVPCYTSFFSLSQASFVGRCFCDREVKQDAGMSLKSLNESRQDCRETWADLVTTNSREEQGSHTEPRQTGITEPRDCYNDFQSSESDSVDPYVPAVRPSLILASLHGATGREEPADRFWGGGPVYGPGSDGAESYGEQLDQEDRYSEMDSAGSYDPYLDDHREDTDYGETEECHDVCLQSDRGSDCEEEAPVEVEEYPRRDLPSHGDAKSSESKDLTAPKAPPRVCRPGASRLTWVAGREALLSDKDTPPPEAKSSRAYAPMPKPRAGKKATAPVPEPGQSPLPRLARDTSRQDGQSSTQPTTGGLVGVHSPFPGLLNVGGVVHVPVPDTVSVPITLNVPVSLFPFVSVPMPVSVCVPVSVIVLVPVLLPATLLALARGRLSGPPTSPFGVGLGAAAW